MPTSQQRPRSELNVPAWKQYLAHDEDPQLAEWLEWGFPTLSDCPPSSVFARNHGSVRAFHDQTLVGLQESVAAGHMLRFKEIPRWPIKIIPLGSVTKKNSDKRRRTSDFSFPFGDSVNSTVDKSQLPELHYSRIWDFAEHLRDLRLAHPTEPIFMLKVDVANAFRQASLRLADTWMACYYYDGWFYVDCRLPFGLSPFTCYLLDFKP